MIRIKIFFFFLLFLQGLMAQDNQFYLKGTISTDFNGKQVKLFTSYKDVLRTDSTTVDQGVFSFNGIENSSAFTRIFVEDLNDRYFNVFLERGQVYINIGKTFYDDSVYGTPLNDLYQTYCDSDAYYSKQVEVLLAKGDGGQISGNNTSMSITKGGYLEKIYERWGGFSVEFKKKNITNAVGKALFKKDIKGTMSEFIWGHGTDSAFQVVYKMADYELQSDPVVKKYFKQKEELANQKKLQDSLIGRKYLDIPLVTVSMKKDKLSNQIEKSNLVLIDFWASWCNPCIGAMPKLKTIYEKFKGKGLNVIGLSEDENSQSWMNMLAKIDTPWNQFLIDGISKNLKKQLYDSYGLRGIPYCVLINKKGQIVHSGPFPTDTELEILLSNQI